MRRTPDAGTAPGLTSARAGRLYRFLVLLSESAQTRKSLLSKLKLDLRSFYRDLETVRLLQIEIGVSSDGKYALNGSLEDALSRLPFPDPGLNVREALQLASGKSPAHRKLRERVDEFIGTPSPARKSR